MSVPWQDGVNESETNKRMVSDQAYGDAEHVANNRAYAELHPHIEREYAGKWVVIAYGALQGVGDSITQIEGLASTAHDRLVFQVGIARPKEIEFGWQMTFV